MKDNTTRIVIVDQRMAASIASDIFSLIVLGGVMAVGLWLNSAALQWIGAIVWILHLFGMASRKLNDRLTIEQARKRLDDLEAAQ